MNGRCGRSVIIGLCILLFHFSLGINVAAQEAPAPEDKPATEPVAPTDLAPADLFPELAVKAATEKRNAELQKMIQQLRELSGPKQLEAELALEKTLTRDDLLTVIEEVQKGNQPEVQAALVRFLGILGDRRVRRLLKFEVEHGQPLVKYEAVTAFGRLKDSWGVPVLVEAAKNSSDLKLKMNAASALGVIGGPEALYALRNTFSQIKDTAVQNTIAWAVGEANGPLDRTRVDENIPPGQMIEAWHKGLKYYFYHPAYRRKKNFKPWMLVCIHDRDLGGLEMFKTCEQTAKDRQIALLAPVFDFMRFPDYDSFNLRGARSDQALWELIDFLTAKADLETHEVFFYGLGAGGDLIQRLALTRPKRIARAAVTFEHATVLEPGTMFPNGLQTTPLAPELKFALDDFVKTDFAFVSPSSQIGDRNTRFFFQTLYDYVRDKGVLTHVIARFPKSETGGSNEPWAMAQSFLFE